MSDTITLSRLALYAYHGVHAEEVYLGQRFYVSLTCSLDLNPAGWVDDYRQTVCYASLAKLVHEIGTTRRFHIIEGLAEALAAAVLERFSQITSLTVRVEKPEAPVPFILDGVAVEIRRSRDG
ncbi:dihydroneopterin aldolase [Microvirga lotononidis]|uniref:7,8-dihydroneopterin aldolase n=1 Tax=Microvirga lotononidis TaxID=864069 RepID=I4YR52_9HYPH|nr:dihydroneopterin aldolase [Microvirga lotononidis]EIM26444.1 dihydroneopterin aldolase [Microvirga lotononidis]WQO30804.1 dihydroneopterin aldolase [Microvirga lotononidis]